MTDTTEQSTSDQVIRVSFLWFILGGIAVLIIGLLGGVLAQQIFQPNLPPLTTGDGEKFVSTVQQVTISPNKAAAELVQAAQRSVVLLGQTTGEQRNWVGTALVVTNDGVIVTSATVPDTNVAAFDATGQPIRLERLGQDELFGLTYFRAPDAVLVPIDLAREDAGVGTILLTLSREVQSLLARAVAYDVTEYIVPSETNALGVQKVGHGTIQADATMTGSPLLDEEGKVRGLLLDPEAGTSVPVSQLQISLQRLTNNQRELNPFAQLGVTIRPAFQSVSPDQPVTLVGQITAITPNSAAYQAGLQRGDIITKVNDQPLDWQQSLVTVFGQKLPLSVTFMRAGQPSTVTIQALSSVSPS